MISALREKGLIDDSAQLRKSWRDALGMLAAPSQWVHLTIGDADEVQTVRYYMGSAGTVAHIFGYDRHEIAFPVKIDESLEEAGNWMGWLLLPKAEPFSVDLSYYELTAMSAATDALCEDQMRAALERRGDPPLTSIHH